MYKDSVKHISSFLVLSNFYLVVFDPYFSRVKNLRNGKAKVVAEVVLVAVVHHGAQEGKEGKEGPGRGLGG